MYRSLDEGNQIPKQIEQQKQRRELALKKKGKLLEYNIDGKLSDNDFLAMNKQCNDDIADAEAQILELEQQLYSKEEFRKHMDEIRKTLQNAHKDAADGMISLEFVEKYIDKILVTPEGDNTMRLDIKIFTGESTTKYLEKLRVRTGHMSKKMIEAYEQEIGRAHV